MRKEIFSTVLAVPAARALSFSNFQRITSNEIPITCQLAYDNQIPSCTEGDFTAGCSAICIAGLNEAAARVISICEGVSVSQTTLLGIVLNGRIVKSLCPQQSTTLKNTLQSIPAASNFASVTIPTDSRGVTGGLGFKPTSTEARTTIVPVVISRTSQAPTTLPTLSQPQSIMPSGMLPSPTRLSSTTFPAATSTSTGLGEGSVISPLISPTTQTRSTSTSSVVDASPTINGGGSGGGSPFDIQSFDPPRSESHAERVSRCAMVIAIMWACLLLR